LADLGMAWLGRFITMLSCTTMTYFTGDLWCWSNSTPEHG